MLKMAREDTQVMLARIIRLKKRKFSAKRISLQVNLSYRAVCLYLRVAKTQPQADVEVRV